ncbi:MAG TPA: SpoIIE family protein phosphatase [Thermomicrobiaceae bacterium]|nr:SpoIIE family protein phosphatase [Thermomicrobiaceae bacterium]
MAPRALTVGAASQPYPGETVNGDAWLAEQQGERWRLALIDGLGHGPEAAAAARAALDALAAWPEASPLDALVACHQALHHTRGAAIAIASIDLAAGQLCFAGVGNVEARLRQDGKERRLMSYRGIVGAVLPRLRAFDLPLSDDWLLVLHSDGVSARFDLSEELPGAHHPDDLAAQILTRWARPTDDATVVVARPPL